MPLYRVTLEYEAYCWLEDAGHDIPNVEEAIQEQHLNDMLNDIGNFDYSVRARRVRDIKSVPDTWVDSVPYGLEDVDKSIQNLFDEGLLEDGAVIDDKTAQMKCAHGSVLDACPSCMLEPRNLND
jgi:hypothetical protein